jgi:heme-degrading monooxygenase HmoA
MYGQLTTVDFDSADQREDALKLISGMVQRVRALRGFQAAYYLDVDALRVIVITIFDSEADLMTIEHEDAAVRQQAQAIGAKFVGTERYPVVAFATTGAP